MKGYDVLTFDDERAGTVVGKQGSNLIVEQGAIFKHRRALPETSSRWTMGSRSCERPSRRTSSNRLRRSGTRGSTTTQSARHYGMVAGDPRRGRGDGALNPDDPAWTAETQEQRTGVEPAAAERARIRRSRSEARAARHPESPGLLGDRRPARALTGGRSRLAEAGFGQRAEDLLAADVCSSSQESMTSPSRFAFAASSPSWPRARPRGDRRSARSGPR